MCSHSHDSPVEYYQSHSIGEEAEMQKADAAHQGSRISEAAELELKPVCLMPKD